MKTILLGTALFVSSSSLALAGETWTGTGELYDAQRQLISPYTITVQTEDVSDSLERVTVEVKAHGEVVHSDVCEIRKAENRWGKTCKDGEGGGYRFANGLGQEYVELKNGHAYATSIIHDSPTRMRLLRTELDGQEAVRFFSEVLEKTAN